MSEIIGLVAMSHSPFATLLPPATDAEPGGAFLADTRRVRAAVAELAPTAVVVIGPDHFHGNFYDAMPPFVLGVDEVIGFGDFASRSGPLPVASDLAWSIRDGLDDAGFDVSLSYSLTVDHGVVQSYDMLVGDSGVPLIPLVVNTAAPPLPTTQRCVALGQALGAALRAAPWPERVLLVASGGLSHWLPSNDPRDPSVTPERREGVIHGRAHVRRHAATREVAVRAMAGDPAAPVNTDWDRWFLKQVASTDLAAITALGDAGLEECAGSGGHEVRTWLIGAAAAAAPLAWTSYEPVPEWITGMGIGTTFPVA